MGGDNPWSKNGDKCRMGGGKLAKFLLDVGPPVPPGKKNPGMIVAKMHFHAANKRVTNCLIAVYVLVAQKTRWKTF